MKRYLLLLLLFCSCPSSLYGKETLTIYTHTTFVSPLYGPGYLLKEVFEKENPDVEVKFVAVDTLPLLLNRLRLEGKRTKADLVLGLEDLVLDPKLFESTTPFASHCLAFIYNAEKIPHPPHSLEELIQSPHKIILQDPRTSITGFGFLVWMKKVFGSKAQEKWKALASHVLTFTKGWSDSTILFNKGEAPILLSYSTDALYHELQDRKPKFKAMQFQEGHLCSSIYAGKTKTTKKGDLVDKFIAFLIAPKAQKVIVERGWVYPVGDMPTAWVKAKNYFVPSPLPYTSEEVMESQKKWIQEWTEGLIR